MPKITVVDGPTFEADPKTRLVNALEDSGVDILHRCGGYARCTTCRVEFSDGEPPKMTVAELERLQTASPALLGEVRLSCQIICDHDMTVKAVYRLAASEHDSPGKRAEDEITPVAQWVDKP